MNFLEEILEVKKSEVLQLKKKYSFSSFTDSESFSSKTLDFTKALQKKNEIAIIAEVKKGSPSKGIIRNDFNPLKIAEIYATNGASAISVLTDEKFFLGNIDYLKNIAINKSVPLLKKDFHIDPIQIFEAKSAGADAILLIAECLSKSQVNELSACAIELGMDVLLELHSITQFEKIDATLNKVIGINNRNLETFEVKLGSTIEIAKLLTYSSTLVSESGISKKEDLEKLKPAGINAVLVGEHFMRQKDIGAALNEFRGFCSYVG